MKKFELSALFFIIIASSIAATYTGTKPSDLNLSTPTEGNTKVSEFNNSDREIKTVIVNLENITTVTGTYTVTGTQTGILGSSTTAFTISFPAASTLATGTITKRFMIKNINSGTITLNLTVDGVGSPTVAGTQTFKLFTDGTSWFEDRVGRAAVASNADLLDNLDSTYFTNATNISTGTVALARIPGTLTGKSADLLDEQTGSYYTNASNLDSGTIPLARIPTTLTGKDADTVDNINGASIVQTSRTISTTAPLAGGSDLSANLTLSMPLATSGQNGYISSADWSTFNNKLSTSRTITTTSPLTIAGVASADLSADRTIAMATATASQDGFLKKEDFQTFNNKANITAGSGITSSSSTGTTTITNNGVLQIVAGTGITVTGNGTGTPTITAVGTLTSGGWLDTGTATIATAGYPVIIHGTLTVDTAYGVTGLLDRDIPNGIALDNLTQVTTRNYSDLSGTATISPTTATITTAVITDLTATNGTISTIYGNGSNLTNIGTTTAGSNIVPRTDSSGNLNLTGIRLTGTTSAITSIGDTKIRNYMETPAVAIAATVYDDTDVLLCIPANAGGSSTTFTDISSYQETLTTGGDAVSSTAYSKFGGASYWGSTGSIAVGTTTGRYNIFGTDTCYISTFIKMDSINTNMAIFSVGATYFYYSGGGANGLSFEISGGNAILQGGVAGWSAGTEYHVALRKLASNGYQLLRDGVVIASGTNSTNWDTTGNPRIGTNVNSIHWKGYIDDFYWEKNTTGTDVVPTTARGGQVTYKSYTTQIIPANSTTPIFKIADAGTTTTEPSYILNNASTTVFGLGTTTAITGTTTAYSGWFAGAVRGTAFNVASSEKIKENVEDIEIKPDLLDAEAEAKVEYIKDNKTTWIVANQGTYTSVITKTGTGTVVKINTVAMEADYANYIELRWASDLNQNSYINNVQKKYEKEFWKKHDSMRPRSWNPKENTSLIRRGFVAEEIPPEFRGQDGLSIDSMAIAAYMTKASQALKADTVFAFSTLQELITKGTVTQKKIDDIAFRLDVLTNK